MDSINFFGKRIAIIPLPPTRALKHYLSFFVHGLLVLAVLQNPFREHDLDPEQEVGMASLGTGGPKESTEWDEILKAKGITPEKTQEELAEEALKELVEETVENYDPHERKSIETLEEELEEADSDEERVLQRYREKRLAQLRAEAVKSKFGPGVTHVSANEWKAQVTEAGEDVYVVVHLVRCLLWISITFSFLHHGGCWV